MTWLLASRRRALFVVLGLLLALDLGRSLYARLAYNTPYEKWDGAPYDLKLAAWPPASNVPAGANLGQKVFIERCAVCHGTAGDGRGVAAPSMYPRPRDFTQGLYKYRSTGPGQLPTDADLVKVVTDGLPASAMPYYKDILKPEEIQAVAAYIKDFSPAFKTGGAQAIAIPPRPAADAASLNRGQEIFRANCATCHGADGRAQAALKDSNGYTVHTRDLTAPWTFRGGSAPEALFTRVTDGLAPSPMPSFAQTLTDAQRWDVVNYVESLARTAPWLPGGQLQGARTDTDLSKRGEYIVHSSICGLCHTQINPTGIYRGDDHYLSGGMRVGAYPQGVFVSRNLTSDPATGLGGKTVEQIADIIRNGNAPDRKVNFWGMPWMFLHSMSQEDALAVATYLKSLPPVHNETPPLMEYGFIETTVMKAAAGLPTAAPKVLTYSEGSYANPNPGPLPADWPRRVLVWAQALVLLAGLVVIFLAGPREGRLPRGLRGWLLTLAAGLGLGLLALVAGAIYNLPNLLPSDVVAQQVLTGLKDPKPEDFKSPEALAMARRGEYLFASVSCAFCHGNDGRGGAKISGLGMGTLWSRNISQDQQYGIGAWSDAEIARAIRSGVSRDGRPLHWQGMPWDHFSNMEEEDVQALVVYLRTLAPVHVEVPAYRPPAPGDCTTYTFWVGAMNTLPGCQ